MLARRSGITAPSIFVEFFLLVLYIFITILFFWYYILLGFQSTTSIDTYPVGIYLLKVNNRNTRTRFEICSKLTIKIPERRQWRRFGIFITNFEHILHLVPIFLLLTLNM